MDEMEEEDDGIISADDLMEDEEDGPWFLMGITRNEKKEAMKTKCHHQIMGRKIGYQFLLKNLHSMWRIQNQIALIYLSNEFFIIRFTNAQDYI